MRHGRRQQIAADQDRRDRRSTGALRGIARALTGFALVGLAGIGAFQAMVHPDTPLPPEWNPVVPLAVDHPVTPLTGWKLGKVAADPGLCVATLQAAAVLQPLPPREDSAQCYISDRITLQSIGQAQIAPLETRCATALRLAMWEEHSLQPAAAEILGTGIGRISHIGSYNCRNLRTASGPSERMSTHATADAVDISGFVLTNGRDIVLTRDWGSGGPEAAFLRAARDGACDWFGLTLSPDFNSLHADHFHMQTRGWGGCR